MNRHKRIGGPGHWIEIDETHLFERQYNRGHRIKGESIWIFGGVDRHTKERFAVRVPDRKRRTLWPIIRKNVARRSILVTDDFASYHGILNCRSIGLSAHEIVVHKYSFVNPVF
jgi:transposase-like protein